MKQETLYVHVNEDRFVMRAERFLPAWNKELRDALGEDAVVQVKVQGKVGWAVQMGDMPDALGVSQRHFASVAVERESFLGRPSFPDAAAGASVLTAVDVLAAIDPVTKKTPVIDDPPWPVDVPAALESPPPGRMLIAMKVHEVGRGVADMGKSDQPGIMLRSERGSFSFTVTESVAREFGKHLYNWVVVEIREPAAGEIHNGEVSGV